MEEVLSSGATHQGVILQLGGVHAAGIGDKGSTFQFSPHPGVQGVKIDTPWLEKYKTSKAYTELHGIGTPFPGFTGNLNSAREIRNKLSSIYPSGTKGLLLGYNLKKFDLPFIQSRIGWSPAFQQQAQIIDVMQMAKRQMPGLKSYALGDVAKALGVKMHGAAMHQSVTDSMVTLEVFRRLSKKGDVGLGEVLRRVHGVHSLDQMKEQEYWHKRNQQYWRAKEAAAMEPTMFIPHERMPIDEKVRAGEMKYEDEEYRRVREAEEGAYRGEHSPNVLNLARDRSAFWKQISPTSVSRKFLTDHLRFTDTQASLLRSGNNASLNKLFAARMGEFEITGHLPRSEFRGDMAATGATSRVVNFGQYALEPDSFFSGMLPSGKSAYIASEQQRSFMSNVFGRTRSYRFAGSGALVTPEQMNRLRVLSPKGEIPGLDSVSDLSMFRGKVEKRLSEYKKLASMEKAGKLVKRERMDPYSFKTGTPGKRGNMLETGDDEGLNLFELMERDAVAAEDLVASPAEQAASKLEFSPNMSREEMDRYAAQLTGMGSIEGQEMFEQAEGGLTGVANEAVSYVERDRFYQNQYKNLKAQYDKAFIFDYIKKPGQKKREKILVDYHPLVKERYAKELQSLKAVNISLAGKAMDESEQIIEDAIARGGKVYAKGDSGYEEIASAPIEKFAELYLKDMESKQDKLFTEFSNDIPDRARAEQIIDVYFKRIMGKKAYGLYTASGTYLGETAGMAGVPRSKTGAAKIFEYKGRYHVGWGPNSSVFAWNKFGAVEQASLENAREKAALEKRALDESTLPREINNLLDLDANFRLKYSSESQENLQRLYLQQDTDKRLLSRYAFDKSNGSYVNVDTGEAVDKMTADMYEANVENSYRRSSKAADILSKPFEEKSGIWESLKNFAGRMPRARALATAALGISAALVTLKAASAKSSPNDQRDVPTAPYGGSTTDQRMFTTGAIPQPPVRIATNYQGMQGYTTNIDIQGTDTKGISAAELAFVMNRHASNAMGTKSSGTNVEINDNSDQSNQYALQRKYANMLNS